jgi:hypothetical protein
MNLRVTLLPLGMLLTIATLQSCQTLTTEIDNSLQISPTQIDQAIQAAICKSFAPIDFSAANDTKATIVQIRRHNAALATYQCDELEHVPARIGRPIK